MDCSTFGNKNAENEAGFRKVGVFIPVRWKYHTEEFIMEFQKNEVKHFLILLSEDNKRSMI